MKRIEKRTRLCLVLAGLLALGLVVFLLLLIFRGSSWAGFAANRHLYSSSGQLTVGRILDREGDVLTWAEEDGSRVYYDGGANHRRSILHAVGDPWGRIGTGAMTAFAGKLSGYNLLTGAQGFGGAGNDLVLTLDDELNYTAYMALNGQKGAVGVYNYKTGEILCMVSTPTFDPANPPEISDGDPAYEGVYLNRFLSSTLTLGSVFKTVTLAAALDNLPGVEQRTFSCSGATEIGDGFVTCMSAHGEQTLQQALTNSCNGVFAILANELGPEVMADYVEKAGLTTSYSVNGISTAVGHYDTLTATENELGWSGIGQFTDTANPCAVMVYMGAIANGGQAAVPQLIRGVRIPWGLNVSPYLSHSTGRLLEQGTADTIAEMMERNVTDLYGAARFPAQAGAKSGTAEVGGGQSPHSWFAGFLRDEEHPYAFVAVVENGGFGSSAAANVVSAVLNAAVERF